MATSAKSQYNHYQNGKYATMPQKDMEISQDMHLKMSKKIAQLTKVIYALNTKNDEHEAVLLHVKEQHEEQMAQLLAETKEKIETYRNKLSTDNASSQQVQTLQRTIQDQEGQRQSALDEFRTYKEKAEQREITLKQQHSENMLELSQQVLVAKKDFEEKLAQFDSVKQTFEAEKLTALEELEAKHKSEIENLTKSLQNQQGDVAEARAELERKYAQEIANLETNIERLDSEKKQISDEYEGKLHKAQQFYENELQVLRNSQNLSYEEQMKVLQDQYDKLKKDFAFQESQTKQRIEGLVNKLSVSEEEAQLYLDELNKLKDSLKNKNSDSDFLNKQLAEARHATSEAVTRLKEAEAELLGSRERCAQQAKELLNKSTELGSLEATRLQHVSHIKDLEGQLAKLRDRVQCLESAKHSLENESQSQVNEKSNQVRALEKALEDLSAEKQRERARYEKEAGALQEESSRRQQQLQQEHAAAVETLSRQHKDSTEAQARDSQIRITNLKQDLEAQMSAETSKLKKELVALQEEYRQVTDELTTKLRNAEQEVRRLEAIVADSQKGLGSASSELENLRRVHDEVKGQLDEARTELRSLRAKCSSLQEEYDSLKKLHESKMRDAQRELTAKLDQLSKDLDTKWAETLRAECIKLRHEVTQQKDEDKRSALAQLTLLKDEEVAAAKKGWEGKVTELLEQISELRGKLSDQEQLTGDQLEDIKREANAENQRLREEMVSSIEGYKRQIAQMEEKYQQELDELNRKKEQEAKDREHELTLLHHEALRSTQSAHRIALDASRDNADRERQQHGKELKDRHSKEIDSLRSELEHRFSLEMEEQSRSHQQMMQAARMELDRALDIAKQKEGEHAMVVSELEDEIRHRQAAIGTLEVDMRKLRDGIADMSKELDKKGQDVLRIRSEANLAARHKEEEMLSAHREEVSNLHLDHRAEAENMLAEFSQAQEILKSRIDELQLLLREAEQRYDDRESRPDDLATIAALQEAVQQREDLLKRMEDDKRFYQLELVNRETNFNKVFSTDPKVGLLNPLAVGKKKKGSAGNSKAFSASNLQSAYGRLEPLPNSPIHNEALTNSKPLPPMKKFVR